MEPRQIISPPMAGLEAASAFYLIGSGAECAFQVASGPDRAAVLLRRDGRLFVRDLGAGASVLVNRSALRQETEVEITRFDQLEVAGAVVEIEARLFLGEKQLGMDTTALFLKRSDGRAGWLCEGAFLRARQGSFTAILGPAGSGKTVFLNLLNGCTRPDRGRIIVGQSYDVHSDVESLRSYLGYVPQDDVMPPELTVRQSLDFRLRLRFPDMAPGVRGRLVQHTCRRLGFHESRLETFLDTVIGSPELGRRGLSGGERRRANIAHELVMKPAILLLDEPTSGLASVDAEQVVKLLQTLAREENLTLVATLHQPSRESFARFDDLLVMGHGGRLAYYGPSGQAVSFFQRASEEPFVELDNPAEYVLRHLGAPLEAGHVIRYYAQHSCGLPQPLSDAPTRAAEDRSAPDAAKPTGRVRGFLANFQTLAWRNITVLLKDRFSLWLAIGQAPLIAMLIWVAFFHFSADAPDAERFARLLYHFSNNQDPYYQAGKNGSRGAQTSPLPVESLADRALAQARSESAMISVPMAQRRGAVYFVLTAAAIWLGVMSGCREIVVEKHVLRREVRSCVRVGPYLLAKLASLMAITGIQCVVLAGLVSPWLLNLPLARLPGLWLSLWVTAGAAGALGLMISALAPSYRAALTAVPLVLIPQLLFGGLMRPQLDMAPGASPSRVAGWLTLQRWGFESSMALDPAAAHGIMVQQFPPETAAATDVLQLLRDLEFKDASLTSVFFSDNSDVLGFGWPLLILAAQGAIFLTLGHFYLVRRLRSGIHS